MAGIRKILDEKGQSELLQKEHLTIDEVSTLLRVSKPTVHSYAKRGLLVKHKMSNRTLFKTVEVLSAIKAMEAKL